MAGRFSVNFDLCCTVPNRQDLAYSSTRLAALTMSIAHSCVEMGQDALKGTRLVDSWFQNGYLWDATSFLTGSFVILILTNACTILHLDTGLDCAALGLHRDRQARAASPAA